MRFLIAATAMAAVMFGAAAHAEKRMFIIANNADGYGVDTCLAGGGSCGQVVANSYCRSHEFSQALSFHEVDRDDITGAIPTDARSCPGRGCDHYVAIVCTR